MGMNVASMRKGKNLGQPTPLNSGLVKQGNMYRRNPAKEATTLSKNPAHCMREGGPLIKQGGRNVPKTEAY